MSNENEGMRFTSAEYRDSTAHARLDSLERSVGQLAETIAGFAEKTDRHLITLADKIGTSQRTDWGIILSGAAIVLTLLGGGWVLISQQSQSMALVMAERDAAQSRRVDVIERSMELHVASDGHVSEMIGQARLEERLTGLDRRVGASLAATGQHCR